MRDRDDDGGPRGSARAVAVGAGIGLIFGAGFGNPGVGMVLGAAAGLALRGFGRRFP